MNRGDEAISPSRREGIPSSVKPQSHPYVIEGILNPEHVILSMANQVSIFLSCENQAAGD
jgi:hypothetical protein